MTFYYIHPESDCAFADQEELDCSNGLEHVDFDTYVNYKLELRKMAVKIRSLKKCIDNNGIKMLVHGPAGVGKTVLCATTGVPTLIISAEKGLLSIRDAPKYIKAAEIKSLDELEEVYQFLLEDKMKTFQATALDSISEIAESVLAYEKARNKDPRAAYGNLADHVLQILRNFRDLPGYDVIMTCKQERVSNDGVNIYMPMMPGAKLAQQIPYLFDEVFALRVEKDEEKNEYRVLQTSRDSRYEAKDRSGVLDTFEPPNLKKLMAKIRKGVDTEGTSIITDIDKEEVIETVEEQKPPAKEKETEKEKEVDVEVEEDGAVIEIEE